MGRLHRFFIMSVVAASLVAGPIFAVQAFTPNSTIQLASASPPAPFAPQDDPRLFLPPPPTTSPPTTSPPTTVQQWTPPVTSPPVQVYIAAAAPAVVYQDSSGGCMRHGRKSWNEMVSCWNSLVIHYSDWSPTRVFTIMQCESGGDPWAYNPSGATGLMQDMYGPFDPAANIAVAHSKYEDSGRTFAQWVCKG